MYEFAVQMRGCPVQYVRAESSTQAAREVLRRDGRPDYVIWDRFPPDPESLLYPDSRFREIIQDGITVRVPSDRSYDAVMVR